MQKFDFTLEFRLQDSRAAPETFVDALYENGCDDASVGTGRPGMIGLDFAREAPDAGAAVASAVADVRRAIPDARQLVRVAWIP